MVPFSVPFGAAMEIVPSPFTSDDCKFTDMEGEFSVAAE